MLSSSIAVDKTPDPASRAPGGVSAAAEFLFQLMGAQLATEAKALKKERVIEKSYCSTVGTVCHIALI